MKLEDIKKQKIHKVPDGYFDELPQQIQARVTRQKSISHVLVSRGLQYALPIVLVLMVAIYWVFFTDTAQEPTAKQLLAQVSTEELINYLDESDITTEEIMDNVDMQSIDFDFEQENTEFINDMDPNTIDDLMQDYDILDDTL